MEIAAHVRIPVRDRSDVSYVRTAIRSIGAGARDDDVERAGLVATELGTNLVKHSTAGGEILVRSAGIPDARAIELIAVDRGPGMDLERCLSDGFSSAGSPGTGLGAIRRLSDVFDAYSTPEGTIVLACVGAGARATVSAFDIGGVSVLKEGEVVCGDAWAVHEDDAGLTVLVADGLGHGPGASEAARAAVGVPADWNGNASCATLLERMHGAIRHTRGAAAAVAHVRRGAATLSFAGIGNVAGAVVTAAAQRQTISNAGTLGHQVRMFREYTYPWTPDAMLVLFTDGLTTHWTIQDLPRLRQRHPAIVAAALYRDHSRQRDDVTVVVLKEAASWRG